LQIYIFFSFRQTVILKKNGKYYLEFQACCFWMQSTKVCFASLPITDSCKRENRCNLKKHILRSIS
jgi:hypothetical protein